MGANLRRQSRDSDPSLTLPNQPSLKTPPYWRLVTVPWASGPQDESYPETRQQRCWAHKTANILNELPKSKQGKAKAALQEIWMAESRKAAEKALEAFVRNYQAKYPKAVAKLEKDRTELLAFYDYPTEHWRHIRTTNAIESTFATVRHRTSRTKNYVSRNSFIGLGFKMLQQAEKRWIGIYAAEKVQDLFAGMKFIDGLPVG